MAELIFLDEDGKETHREQKGRGRPPRGSEKQEDGNFIVRFTEKIERQVVEYIDVSEGGDVISRENKGRGRPRPDYTKMTDGEHIGHWVRMVTEEVPV